MKIDVIISVEHINDSIIQGKTVVVIDMLRATSVIVTALNNGYSGVIPTTTVDEAREIVKDDKDKFVLGGERNAQKIEGFDFSNSPLDYIGNNSKHRVLVMTTSNGTKAIKKCEKAENILIGAVVNGSAVAKQILQLNNDVVIVNAGTAGEFTLDDFMCAGFVISKIIDNSNSIEQKVELTDIAFLARHTYEENRDILTFIKNAAHYNTLHKLGLIEDVEYCCSEDIAEIVPEYRDGMIKVNN